LPDIIHRMRTEKRVAVVMPAKNETKSLGEGRLLERILEEIPDGYVPKIYVCASNATPDFMEFVDDVTTQDDRVDLIDLGAPDPRGLAYAYLHGLNHAVSNGADMVIEMDANGAHDPGYIPEFIERMSKDEDSAVFASRFSDKGGINQYPLQRKLISQTGTFLANITLGLETGWVDDMTSGYEAFNSSVLKDVFKTYPIENWISVERGPGHFYQTEMRTLVIWRKHSFELLPIVWGTDRMEEPVTLPAKTVIKALTSLMILRSKKGKILRT
jgi:dolichol-phosphate mannosyltransferase